MSKEAMKLALEALDMYCEHGAILRPIETRDAIKEALAKQEQGKPSLVQNEANVEEMHAIGNGIMYGEQEQRNDSEQLGEPVAGVVIREGNPTLLRDKDIKPTDERLYTTPQPKQEQGEPVALEALKWIASLDLSGADNRAIALMAYAIVSKARFAVLEATGERA